MPDDEGRHGAMLSAILPVGIACAEAVGDFPETVLFPEELEAIDRAVLKRRREFAAGRALARAALARLGIAPTALPRSASREPQWPPGIVGSITHCEGYCAAAVARARCVASIGIDAEPHAHLPAGVLDRVTMPDERPWIAARMGDAICWDRLLFSAKESLFKAWFPLERQWLDFTDASIEFETGRLAFRASLHRPPPGTRVDSGEFVGRFLVRDGHVLTCVTVSRC
jgi:4'-phosphopantetheinyl transferase EntD